MSNEKQQTAMEILFDRIKLKADSIPTNNQANRLIKGAYVDCLMLIREAKEMEKQRAIKFACDVHMNVKKDKVKSLMQLVDEKYNETYGGNK
jgi:hypothetical protein